MKEVIEKFTLPIAIGLIVFAVFQVEQPVASPLSRSFATLGRAQTRWTRNQIAPLIANKLIALIARRVRDEAE